MTRAQQPPAVLTADDKQALLDRWGFKEAQVKALKSMVAPKATEVEFVNFIEYCRSKGADPFERDMYCVVYEGQRRSVTFQTGIDRFRKLANSDPAQPLVGSDEPVFGPMVNAPAPACKQQFPHPEWCSVTVRKQFPSGHIGAFVGKVWWDEYYPGDGTRGQMWQDKPRNQLAKCAEAQALRKASPGVGRLYVTEEMERMDAPRLHAATASDTAPFMPAAPAAQVHDGRNPHPTPAAELPPPDPATHLASRRQKRLRELTERGLMASAKHVWPDLFNDTLSHQGVNDLKVWIADFDALDEDDKSVWRDPSSWTPYTPLPDDAPPDDGVQDSDIPPDTEGA